ncbi:MAG: tRNA epoxyqueuosine(34) reductase QueG [Pseudomonadota bacterium]
MSEPAAIKQAIAEKAAALGFDAVGFAAPNSIPDTHEQLRAFLDAGRHGSMDWLATRWEERASPAKLWPEVRTIIMLGLNYGPADDPMTRLRHGDVGVISVYAQGADYHKTVKSKLKALARDACSRWGGEAKVFVDTAPVAEKPLAQAAGLGWTGKHTNLVSRARGSWLFLGAVFTTLELEPDAPETDHCGDCRACLDACPTNAFPAPYQLDARRCVSYLTIEHKGTIPAEFRPALGNRIYGCDDCLAVCPWNKFAVRAREAAFHPRAELAFPLLADLAELDDAGFRRVFAGSPIKRTGRDRFVRNVLIAIGNSQDRRLAAAAEARLDDASPLVRAMAVWASARLVEPARFVHLAAAGRAGENDPDVLAEWAQAAPSP